MSRQFNVAALFVYADGVYSDLDGVDVWCEQRDAFNYDDRLPVVCHPPCQRWGALAAANYARWGGDHNRPGNDGGVFAFALKTVRRCGGVLEHPAKTRAFNHHGIARPTTIGWNQIARNEWVCEVWQSAYGHRANKATWLLYVGDTPPLDLNWQRSKGTHQIGFADKRGKGANKPTLSRREANDTPEDFARLLVTLALLSQPTARQDRRAG